MQNEPKTAQADGALRGQVEYQPSVSSIRGEWPAQELEQIASQVRINLVGHAGAATLEEFVEAAREKSVAEIGKFYLWIAKSEPELRRYLPDAVIDVLSEKAPKRFLCETQADAFIRRYKDRGAQWLADRLHIGLPTVEKRVNSVRHA